MSSTRNSILQSLREIRLIDPHSHINPHQPASKTLADLLGYHYYTELVHSAGMPKSNIESPDLQPRELVRRLVSGLHHLSNTAQHAWLLDICHRFFGFDGDVVDESNWESLYEAAESKMQMADWSESVLEQSNVEAVFLTNDFDDKLEGFDTKTYIPCLRTDDLVFHLSKSEVRERLSVCSGIHIDGSLKSLRDAIQQRFEHFVSHGARACAISLPPDFSPAPVSDGRAATALDAILRSGVSADDSHKAAIARRVFWTIVEMCDQFRLPMDLMIGVNRGVYAEGVYQGRDLYDSRVSLIQYRELFNAFPEVKFPVSVLASVTNQELVSYAWIFPNVITNGHWWYSNTPSFIHRDASARLEAVPRNKQIGYYSDAYKLEFIAPKFDMYRRILAGILYDDFVVERGWSEEKAIELGYQVLRGNVDTLFPDRSAETTITDLSDSALSLGDDLSPTVAPLAAPLVASTVLAATEWESQDLSAVDPLSEMPLDEVEVVELEPEDPELLLKTVDFQSQDDLSPLEFGDTPEPEQSPEVDSELEQPTSVNESVAIDDTIEMSNDEIDPYATLQFYERETDSEAITFADDNANGLTEASDQVDSVTESNQASDSDDPSELELMFEDLDDSESLEPSEHAGIRYFRADDEPGADDNIAETVDLNDEDESAGMFSDPVTGELTLPTRPDDAQETDDNEADYLLATDSEPAFQLADQDVEETLAFEELELEPIEDAPGDLSIDNSSNDDPIEFDPEQTADMDFLIDDEEEQPKPGND